MAVRNFITHKDFTVGVFGISSSVLQTTKGFPDCQKKKKNGYTEILHPCLDHGKKENTLAMYMAVFSD